MGEKMYVPDSFQEGRLFSDQIIIEPLLKLLTVWVIFILYQQRIKIARWKM